jgi:hypothetical protein
MVQDRNCFSLGCILRSSSLNMSVRFSGRGLRTFHVTRTFRHEVRTREFLCTLYSSDVYSYNVICAFHHKNSGRITQWYVCLLLQYINVHSNVHPGRVVSSIRSFVSDLRTNDNISSLCMREAKGSTPFSSIAIAFCYSFECAGSISSQRFGSIPFLHFVWTVLPTLTPSRSL